MAETDMVQENTQKVARMGTAPIGRLVLEFAIPAVASVVLNALYNVIDSIFLGQAMGDLGLAATTVASPIMTIMLALSVLAGSGGNTLCAILLGERRNKDAETALGNSLTIIIIISIIVALYATFWLDPLLCLCGADEETLPYARQFVKIILYACLFNNIAFGINNFIRTAGAPTRALLTVVIGTVVCIGLNALFVLAWGWGVTGSALATVLGQAVSSLFVLYYFTVSKKAPFKLKLSRMKLNRGIALRLLSLGTAPFALQAAAAVTQVVGNAVLASLGAADAIGQQGAMASVGVVMKISMFVIFPTIGVATAVQPLLGYNVGARYYDRVLRTLCVALGAGTAILVALFAVIHLIPEQVVGLFNVDAEHMEFSVYALKVQTIFIPLVAVQVIGSNYFQATGQPTKATVLSLTRQLIFLLPMYFLLPSFVPQFFSSITPLMCFSLAFPVADALSIALCAVFLLVEVKHLRQKIAAGQTSPAKLSERSGADGGA